MPSGHLLLNSITSTMEHFIISWAFMGIPCSCTPKLCAFIATIYIIRKNGVNHAGGFLTRFQLIQVSLIFSNEPPTLSIFWYYVCNFTELHRDLRNDKILQYWMYNILRAIFSAVYHKKNWIPCLFSLLTKLKWRRKTIGKVSISCLWVSFIFNS